ncbi:acyl-CoA N-acyltransferase [Armillaria mellea]|nr:acyl-CoA N-acyltransferase [Armillaria mellea]
MNIRLARIDDLSGMQAANLINLPENYVMKFWMYHLLTWPQISFVAETGAGKIVGYVLAKIEDENPDDASRVHGHVNSISVLRSRRLMMLSREKRCRQVFNAEYVSLHVRKSNKAAIGLYRDTLGFSVADVEKKYYGDGEDALSMKLFLHR